MRRRESIPQRRSSFEEYNLDRVDAGQIVDEGIDSIDESGTDLDERQSIAIPRPRSPLASPGKLNSFQRRRQILARLGLKHAADMSGKDFPGGGEESDSAGETTQSTLRRRYSMGILRRSKRLKGPEISASSEDEFDEVEDRGWSSVSSM
jgi:hypothetical protein